LHYRDVRAILTDTLAIFYRMHILHYYDRPVQCQWKELPAAASAREVERLDAVI
jgi:hypothetical protein